jgi:hypothetical protein
VSNSSGNTGLGIADRIEAVMETNALFDLNDVVHVVTYTASNSLNAHQHLSNRFVWLLFSHCIPHQVHLLLEDLGKLLCVHRITEKGCGIASCLNRSKQMRQMACAESSL